MAGAETIEFRHEFVRETFGLLRKRLRNFALGMSAVWVLVRAIEWIDRISEGIAEQFQWLTFVGLALSDLLMAGVLAWSIYVGLDRGSSRNMALYTSLGLISFFSIHLVISNYWLDPYTAPLLVFGAVHVLASINHPWTGGQATIPLLVFLVARGVYVFSDGVGEVWSDVLGIAMSSLVALPGILYSSVRHEWRQHRFGYRALSNRYGVLRNELASARRIHEALFPEPLTEGEIRVTYRYEPMRHIGGDYLHLTRVAHGDAAGSVSLVLVDVTGHGIPAALTVNRLHGEVELLYADDPSIPPGKVLKHLNRYVNLTLAKHSVYATALCLRCSPKNHTVEIANGGHPPVFLHSVDGTLDEISSTAFMLGACRDDEFDPGTRVLPFHPGDKIIAYTDGVTEARAPDGRMMRIEGFRSLIATTKCPQGMLPELLLSAIAEHRGGAPTDDDTLVVEIHRMLRMAEPVEPQSPGSAHDGVLATGITRSAD